MKTHRLKILAGVLWLLCISAIQNLQGQLAGTYYPVENPPQLNRRHSVKTLSLVRYTADAAGRKTGNGLLWMKIEYRADGLKEKETYYDSSGAVRKEIFFIEPQYGYQPADTSDWEDYPAFCREIHYRYPNGKTDKALPETQGDLLPLNWYFYPRMTAFEYSWQKNQLKSAAVEYVPLRGLEISAQNRKPGAWIEFVYEYYRK